MTQLTGPLPIVYRRRATRVVSVGSVRLGGDEPIRVQSMTTTDTGDWEGTALQTQRLVAAGCEIVRVTVPNMQDAAALEPLRRRLEELGVNVPLVADIHFNPHAAMVAADTCEKVRINPGNYADVKKFGVREYDDAEYQAEIDRIREKFTPLVLKCKRLGRSMRIGTNHGSLSDRIMNRHGDTPMGMVESALEFVRLCEEHDYRELVISMKSSNPFVAVQAYRLLAERMDAEGMNYPFHLGVTEAGNGEDGRVKSAIGIGALLADGIGDTIRVSLTEDPVHEVPVAFALVRPYNEGLIAKPDATPTLESVRLPVWSGRRPTQAVSVGNVSVGGDARVSVWIEPDARELLGEPGIDDTLADGAFIDLVGSDTGILIDEQCLDPRGAGPLAERFARAAVEATSSVKDATGRLPLLVLDLPAALSPVFAVRLTCAWLDEAGLGATPLLLIDNTAEASAGAGLDPLLEGAARLGGLLVDGMGDALLVRAGDARTSLHRALNILQVTRLRMTRPDYIACPSCGRTLFDLEEVTARIKSTTWHLKGVKIAIMGCIVNGLGEMADADFGYVGSAPGKVNLYVGKECVEKSIPAVEAERRLVELIKAHGRWVEPPVAVTR